MEANRGVIKHYIGLFPVTCLLGALGTIDIVIFGVVPSANRATAQTEINGKSGKTTKVAVLLFFKR